MNKLLSAVLFFLIANTSVAQEITWHIGGPVPSSPISAIRGLEALSGKVYYTTSPTYSMQAALLEYDPDSGRSRFLYRASSGAGINAIRKDSDSSFVFTENSNAVITIKKYDTVNGSVSTVATVSGYCADPWDILVEPDGYVLACAATNSIVKVDRTGRELFSVRPSGLCNPSTRGFYAPVSVERIGSRYYVVNMGCRTTWESDLLFNNVMLFAGMQWENSIGNIVPGRTRASLVGLPAGSVRKIDNYLLLGIFGAGVVAVNPNTGIIERYWSSGRPVPVADNDSLGFGRYVAVDGRYIWAAGPYSLVSIVSPWYSQPTVPIYTSTHTASPTATRTSTFTKTPTNTVAATPTPTNTVTATPLPTNTQTTTIGHTAPDIRKICEAAKTIVEEVCER